MDALRFFIMKLVENENVSVHLILSYMAQDQMYITTSVMHLSNYDSQPVQ